MWSDPIENALATAHTLLDAMRNGRAYSPSQVDQAVQALRRAREVRELEVRAGRLVTPDDNW